MPLGHIELLVVLVIIVLLFGSRRISQVARELGEGIRAFKKEVGAESPNAGKER